MLNALHGKGEKAHCDLDVAEGIRGYHVDSGAWTWPSAQPLKWQ